VISMRKHEKYYNKYCNIFGRKTQRNLSLEI
jgi:hypothetical protein